ncbi:S-methyl-5'-thioadenosine phosphorylase [Nitrosomonas communis]|uniref:S-methyl-5'-thioadenosine phosphorylase n=1 Tax=Nitrosomonas communis TaxID=44574 RepID=UPI003D2C61CC
MIKAEIGIIGGSGLYRMANLHNAVENTIGTPFGKPSDNIVTGEIDGIPVAFLARHDRDHSLLPSEVPYRANIFALKQLGVRYLLSFSAVGSLREDIAPLDMVIPDQYLDLTKKRDSTFFGDGVVAHVSMAHPVCDNLGNLLAQAVELAAPDIHLHPEGTYICIEGPQFSSLVESNWYRSMGASVIGMTNMPEAKLAREAQIAYASLAMVTDYDCWHSREAHVTTELAITNLMKNAERAQNIAIAAIRLIAITKPQSSAHDALKQALVTPIETLQEPKKGIINTLLANCQ